MTKKLEKLQDELFMMVDSKNMSKKEKDEIIRFIDIIINKLSPTYNSIEELRKNRDKRKKIFEKFKKINEALDGKRNT
jgi:RAB protein geranylgeranyltransferase component A|tara:strand:+ start:2659 stop:2892 length:234 start_codon:yes stop_codon:yes gene_type:complete